MMEVTYWNEFHVTKIKIKSTESKEKKYRIEFKNKNSVCHFYDIIDRGRRSFGSCREQLEMIDLVRRFPIDVGSEPALYRSLSHVIESRARIFVEG